jgi:hypothetical protein
MRLDELRNKILGSDPADWEQLDPQGLPEGHDERAIYRPDVAIGLGWGHGRDDFSADWVKKFPNPSAHSEYIALLYNGVVVAQEMAVRADGARYLLPFPDRVEEESTVRWTVGRDAYTLAGLVHSLSASWPYEEGIRQAGFEVQE